jgi:hypothetical protein
MRDSLQPSLRPVPPLDRLSFRRLHGVHDGVRVPPPREDESVDGADLNDGLRKSYLKDVQSAIEAVNKWSFLVANPSTQCQDQRPSALHRVLSVLNLAR